MTHHAIWDELNDAINYRLCPAEGVEIHLFGEDAPNVWDIGAGRGFIFFSERSQAFLVDNRFGDRSIWLPDGKLIAYSAIDPFHRVNFIADDSGLLESMVKEDEYDYTQGPVGPDDVDGYALLHTIQWLMA